MQLNPPPRSRNYLHFFLLNFLNYNLPSAKNPTSSTSLVLDISPIKQTNKHTHHFRLLIRCNLEIFHGAHNHLFVYYSCPSKYRPSVHRLLPQYRRPFSSPKYNFSWLYIMTPFTASFRILPLFRHSREHCIGRDDCYISYTSCLLY